MASAYGNTVHHWRARVVAEITSQTATQATVRTRAYWCSIGYGYDVYANGEAVTGSYSSGKKQFVASSGTGQSVETLVAEVSHTYNKGDKAQSIPCKSVVQVTGGFGNGTSTASTSVSIPAIDYDAPAAPSNCSASRSSDAQAKVTWSNGSTGTTTPRSATLVERQADGGAWSQIASVGASATNYTDNSISADHRYAYRVRAQGAGGYSGYATSDYIYTTPAAPSSVVAEKTGAQAVQLSIEGAAPWATSYAVERSTDGGSQWASAGTAESFPWVDSSAPAGTVVYRVAAVRGSLQSAWAQSNSVTTITPPLAPTVTGLPNVAATGSTLTAQWVPNHPDGSAQTQAQVECTIGDGSPQTATVEGASTSYTLPASATASAGTVKVRVRTHGVDPDWGAWSAYSTVAVAVPPSAHLTNPASDGATVAALPLVLAWEATDPTGIASQTLSLMGADGSTLLTRQLAGDVRSFRIDDSVYALANLASYTMRLAVLGGSSLSAVAERQFSTDWAEPSLPVADLRVDPSDLSCAVTVLAGEGEGAEAAVAEVPEGKTAGGAVVYGSTRQNLWVNPTTVTSHGITLTSNPDGTVTVGGTSDAVAYINAATYRLVAGAAYTLSVDRAAAGARGFYIVVYDGSGAAVQTVYVGGSISSETESSFVAAPSGVKAVCGFGVDAGETVSGTYRVMLNEGDAAEPWCPPGLNGVDELGIVTAGKNLLPPLKSGDAAISLTENSDGTFNLYGTKSGYSSTIGGRFYLPKGKTLAMSFAGDVNQDAMPFLYVEFIAGSTYLASVKVDVNAGVRTFSVPEYADECRFAVYVASNTDKYPMQVDIKNCKAAVTIGDAASHKWSPPVAAYTPVDLDGHILNSLPDGTRDELRIGPDGSCRIVKRTWTQTVTGDDLSNDYPQGKYTTIASQTVLQHDQVGTSAWGSVARGDVLPPISSAFMVSDLGFSGTSDASAPRGLYLNAPGNSFDECRAWLNAHPLTFVYKLAEPVEVELPPVSLSLAGPGLMWADAPVPAAARPVYMLGSSFSVVRVLADGSQWLVADGLTDGQQAIDPLPPLNVDFSYLVTAYAETGVSSALIVPARVEAVLAAFNFGDAAATCELARLDPSWSHSPKRSGTLYHFADGGEAGGLPVPYGGADVDSTRSMGFTVLDPGQLRRLQELAAKYYTCWYRDVYGGRALCAVAWSFSSGIPYGKVDVSADMTEAVFEEAW